LAYSILNPLNQNVMRANSSKSPRANLEKRRPLFFVIGLTTALFLTIVALEWTAPVSVLPDFSSELASAEEVDWTIPVTVTRSPKLPAKAEKAPKINPNRFKIIDNNLPIIDLGNELFFTGIDDGLEVVIDPDPVDPSEVFSFVQVETMPVFQGCEDAIGNDALYQCMNVQLMRFIAREFNVSERMMQFSSGEKVYVEFIIEKNGDVSEAKMVRGSDELVGEEAIRVVQSLPDFTPAKLNGKPVRMSYILPINVKLH
jgi:protein TonB